MTAQIAPPDGARPPARALHPWVAEGRDRVRFGIAYGPRSDWPACRDLVQAAEGLGFDSYWAMDHPTSGFDCWTELAALAGATGRIRLGSLRSPATIAP